MRRMLDPVGGEEEEGIDIYVDERENLLTKFNSHNDILSLLMKTQLFKSTLFKHIIIGFLVVNRFGIIIEENVKGLIKNLYLPLYMDDINQYEFQILKEYGFENILFCHVSDYPITGDDPFMIQCVECHKIKISTDDTSNNRNRLYLNITTESHIPDKNKRETSYTDVAYCSYSKSFYCYHCQPVTKCESCHMTISTKHMVTPLKCITCLHGRSQVMKRCRFELNHNDNDNKDYHKVRLCSLCRQFCCKFDGFITDNGSYIFCMQCLSRAKQHGISLNDNRSLRLIFRFLSKRNINGPFYQLYPWTDDEINEWKLRDGSYIHSEKYETPEEFVEACNLIRKVFK
jgi:hypothetical protein